MSVNWSVSKSGITVDEISTMTGEEESVPADKLTQIRDLVHGFVTAGTLGDPAVLTFDVSISASEIGSVQSFQVSVTSSPIEV